MIYHFTINCDIRRDLYSLPCVCVTSCFECPSAVGSNLFLRSISTKIYQYIIQQYQYQYLSLPYIYQSSIASTAQYYRISSIDSQPSTTGISPLHSYRVSRQLLQLLLIQLRRLRKFPSATLASKAPNKPSTSALFLACNS